MGSRQDARTASPPGCWDKPDLGLVGPRTRTEPGDSSRLWQWVNVGEVGAGFVARLRFECAGSEVTTGFCA